MDDSEILSVDFNLEDPSLIDCSEAKDRGVLKKILKQGTGAEHPFDGSTVFVHYVGRSLDGSIFDSSRKRGDSFSFELGKRKVIKAWDMGVATMKKDEVAELYCTSEYAYGKSGSGPKIPPNATLVFQVELLSWEDEDISTEKNKKLMRRIVKKGTGFGSPNDGATVKAKLSGSYQNVIFDEREVSFVVGEGEDQGLIIGIETAVKKMKKMETSLITVHPDLAFGREGKQDWNIPSNAQVQYQIQLLDFEKAKESWSLSPEEKLEAAEKHKEKGAVYFTKGNIRSSVKQYEKMKDLLSSDHEFKDAVEERRKKLFAVAHLNLAAAFLKQNDFYSAKNAADEALKLETDNVKGLYRRGMAFLGLKEYEEARKDFQRLLEVDPDNKLAKQQLHIVSKEMRVQSNREKMMFRGMFERFAAEDSKADKNDTRANDSKNSGDSKIHEASEANESSVNNQDGATSKTNGSHDPEMSQINA